MNLNVSVTGNAIALPKQLTGALQPKSIAMVAGRSGRNTVRDHLFAINGGRANKLGGRRTNFYTRAARSTRFTHDESGAVIAIKHTGVRLQYHGGTITAGQNGSGKKFLTIPVSPKAHGKRASEFDGLKLIPLKPANKALLVLPPPKHAKNKSIGEVLYVLKRSVTIPADRGILPSDERILNNAASDLQAHVKALAK